MTFKHDSTYPSRRAYVVKVRSEATPAAIAGRLENLVTGKQCDFASAVELIDRIQADLADAEGEGDGQSPPERPWTRRS